MPPELMAILAIAGKAHDELSKNGSNFINQYFSRRAEERAYNREKQFFIWDAVLQNYFANRSESMQREAWDRDDNSYQRTVKDMRAAGLNPLMMSGTTNSDAVSFGGSSSASAPQGQGTQLEGSDVSSLLSSIAQYQLDKEALNEQKNVNRGNDESRVNADRIANAQEQRAKDLHDEEMKQQRVQTQILEAQKKKADVDADDASYELNYKRSHGYSSTSNDKVKLAKETVGTAKDAVEKVAQPILDAEKNKTVISQKNDSNNLSDFSEWLRIKHEAVYKDYKLALADGDTRRIEQIRQKFRNEFMNSSKEFRHEKRR